MFKGTRNTKIFFKLRLKHKSTYDLYDYIKRILLKSHMMDIQGLSVV